MAHEVLHLREEVRKAPAAPAAAIAVPNNPATNDAVPNECPEPPGGGVGGAGGEQKNALEHAIPEGATCTETAHNRTLP